MKIERKFRVLAAGVLWKDVAIYEGKALVWNNEETQLVPILNDDQIARHGEPLIMQYIGWSDYHGKEIYEGDIVDVEGRVCKIEWRGCGYWFCDIEDDDCYVLTPEVYKMEIIGNIYENPELLESGRVPAPQPQASSNSGITPSETA